MRLVLLNKDNPVEVEALTQLLINFSKEVWDEGTVDVQAFIQGHWCVYLALVEDEVVGFSSYIINYYFGLRPPTLGNTYIYILEQHRSSKAMYLFSLQSGQIAMDNGFSLEHYYGSESSLKLSRKVKGTKIYETWIYDIGEVEKTFNRLKNKVRIK